MLPFNCRLVVLYKMNASRENFVAYVSVQQVWFCFVLFSRLWARDRHDAEHFRAGAHIQIVRRRAPQNLREGWGIEWKEKESRDDAWQRASETSAGQHEFLPASRSKYEFTPAKSRYET